MKPEGWVRSAVIVLAVGGLELACRTGVIPPTMVVAPSNMVVGVVQEIGRAGFWFHLKQSLVAVGIALVLSITIGFIIGFILTQVQFLRRATAPFLAAYYSIPHIAFYPLLIVIFGLGRAPLIFLATLFAMVAMIMATMTGLDRISSVLQKTAKVYRMSKVDEILNIRLPAALPHILSGLKLAIAYSFIGVIAGEFIMSTSGIGHEIAFSYDNFNNQRMYSLILIVLALVTSVNMAVFAFERRLLSRRGL